MKKRKEKSLFICFWIRVLGHEVEYEWGGEGGGGGDDSGTLFDRRRGRVSKTHEAGCGGLCSYLQED